MYINIFGRHFAAAPSVVVAGYDVTANKCAPRMVAG